MIQKGYNEQGFVEELELAGMRQRPAPMEMGDRGIGYERGMGLGRGPFVSL